MTTSEGRLLAGYPDLPEPAGRVSDPLFYDGRFRNSDVRLVAVSQPIAAPAKHLTGTIVVAESLHGRDAMQLHLWRGTAFAQLVLVVFASALAWYGQRRDLAPLVRLGGEIRKRRPDEFRPFATTTLQSELHPFVAALNDSMQRLQQQLDAQRRFTANAAHQLRTPLTLLRTQATYALRGTTETERNEANRAILSTAKQLTRLTNQLLSLARAEPHGQPLPRGRTDLATITRTILEEVGPLAIERGVDLEFADSPAEAPVLADATAMRDMIVNVVDNALRYCGTGGHVWVSVTREAHECVLRVEDSGPGLRIDERKIVFERFQRAASGDSDGSGLGLAIVKEIVEGHGGRISLSSPDSLRGLVVEIRLPVLNANIAEARRPPFEEPPLDPG